MVLLMSCNAPFYEIIHNKLEDKVSESPKKKEGGKGLFGKMFGW